MPSRDRRDIVVRVATGGDPTLPSAGLGVIVGEARVVTCAHVVNTALRRDQAAADRPSRADRIAIQVPLLPEGDDVLVWCWVDEWCAPDAPGPSDVAGLVVVEGDALPSGAGVARLADLTAASRNVEASIFGYPGDPPRKQRGAWSTCVVRDTVGGGLVQLDGWRDAVVRVQPGFSGSPIVVPDGSGDTVVGILQLASRDDQTRDAYAIPVTQLIDALPALADKRVPVSPYRGLRAFTAADAKAGLFVGREDEVDALAHRLHTQPVALVVGPSGVGKSSLVQAGASVQFSNQGWRVASCRLRGDPLLQLAIALVDLERPGGPPPSLDQARARAAEIECRGLATTLDDIAIVTRSSLLLIVDQLEELFAPAGTPDAVGSDWVLEHLFPAASLRPRDWRIVATLRADFYGRLLESPGLADRIVNRELPVSPMGPEALARVIREPAAQLDVVFERGLVERIMDDTGRGRGGLPLLQFALAELWPRQRNGAIGHQGYEDIGRIDGALARYASDVMAGLGLDFEQLRRLFLRLVRTRGGAQDATRAQVRQQDVSDEDWHDLLQLAERRLVVLDTSGSDATAELAHEELVRSWPQLREWVDEDAEFQRWLAVVEDRVSDDEVLTGSLLAASERWVVAQPDRVVPTIAAFVARSVEARDQQIARDVQRALAERVSTSLRLANHALDTAAKETETSLLLALESLRWDRNDLGIAALRQALRHAKHPVRIVRSIAPNSRFTTFDYVPTSGGELVVGDSEGVVARYRLDEGPAGTFEVAGSGKARLAAAPDDGVISWRAGILRHHARDGRELSRWEVPLGGEVELGSSGDLVVVHDSRRAWLVQLQSGDAGELQINEPGDEEHDGTGHQGSKLMDVRVDAGLRRVWSEGADGTVRVWDLDGVEQATISMDDDEPVIGVLLPDGRVVVGSWHGSGAVCDPSGRLLRTLRTPESGEENFLFVSAIHEATERVAGWVYGSNVLITWDGDGVMLREAGVGARPRSMCFAPAGDLVATGLEDGMIRLVPVTGDEPAVVLRSHSVPVTWVAFDRTRPYLLLSGDESGSVRTWDLTPDTGEVIGAHAEVKSSAVVGGHLVTSSEAETRVWQARGALPIPGRLLAWASGPQNDGAMATAAGGRAHVWRLGRNGPEATWTTPLAPMGADDPVARTEVQVSPSGSTMVVVVEGNATLVRNGAVVAPLPTGSVLRRKSVTWAAIDPVGASVCCVSEGGGVWFWAADGSPRNAYEFGAPSQDVFKSFEADPVAGLVLVGMRERALVFDWSGRKPLELPVAGYKVTSVAASPDGERILTAADRPDGDPPAVVELWAPDGTRLGVLRLKSPSPLLFAAFSMDSSTFGVSDGDGVAVFDRDGAPIGRLTRSRGTRVFGVVAGPGATIAATFGDGAVIVWDGDARRAAPALDLGDWRLVRFTPEGDALHVLRPDGSMERHPLLLDELLAAAAERVDRVLADEEIERFGIDGRPLVDLSTLHQLRASSFRGFLADHSLLEL